MTSRAHTLVGPMGGGIYMASAHDGSDGWDPDTQTYEITRGIGGGLGTSFSTLHACTLVRACPEVEMGGTRNASRMGHSICIGGVIVQLQLLFAHNIVRAY